LRITGGFFTWAFWTFGRESAVVAFFGATGMALASCGSGPFALITWGAQPLTNGTPRQLPGIAQTDRHFFGDLLIGHSLFAQPQNWHPHGAGRGAALGALAGGAVRIRAGAMRHSNRRSGGTDPLKGGKDFLFGIAPEDPTAIVAAVLTLGAAAVLASYVPAMRATKVDPMVALRHD
jgi:ABC-type antimicrobial peptide transport system permease subunit